MTDEQTDELMSLWARLERLKVGIGGWVITAACLPGTQREAIEADDRIRKATQEALDVKARIEELQGSPMQSAPTSCEGSTSHEPDGSSRA